MLPPLDQLPASQAALAATPHGPAGLPVPRPTPSFWLSAPGANPRAAEGSTGPLTDDADVCIIGAGITGVATAYHLARAARAHGRPLNVVLLDARDFCSGATGRNGGHLVPNPFLGFRAAAAAVGAPDARRALALERHTAAALVRAITAAGAARAVDLAAGGRVALFLSEREARAARADYDAAAAAGERLAGVEWLDAEHMRTVSRAPQHYGTAHPGVRCAGHTLWPPKLAALLLARAEGALALALHTRTPATAVAALAGAGPRRWAVATPRGRVCASVVVHATNAHVSRLVPHLAGPAGVVPTRGQVVALRARGGLPAGAWGANEGFEYWSARAGGVVVLGGGREAAGPGFEAYVEDDGAVSAAVGAALRGFLPAVFPGTFEEGAEPEMEWSGIMGFTAVGDPFVGPVVDTSRPETREAYKGQYVSAGYTGHGMARAFGCASVVADMILAEMAGEEWKAPEWFPEHFLTWNR